MDVDIYPTCCENCGATEVPLYHIATEDENLCGECIELRKEKILVVETVKIRAKLDELMRRPTGLNPQLADIYRGRIEALRWVLGEIKDL